MRNIRPLAAVPPGPYTWHEFLSSDFAPVFKIEAVAALRHWKPPLLDGVEVPETITNELFALRVAEYRRLVNLAKAGGAAAEDWDSAGHNPVVWELRMNYGDELFRFYFCEPPTVSAMMVALLAHHKDLGGSEQDISDRQTALIVEATARYNAGQQWSWGLDAHSLSNVVQLDRPPWRP